MMAVGEWHLDAPRPIRLARHRMRRRIPIVEIALETNLPGFGCMANEGNGFNELLGGITVKLSREIRRVHLFSASFVDVLAVFQPANLPAEDPQDKGSKHSKNAFESAYLRSSQPAMRAIAERHILG